MRIFSRENSLTFTLFCLSLNLLWWKLVDPKCENILAREFSHFHSLWWKLVVDQLGENILAREFSHFHSILPKSEFTMVKASRAILWEYSHGENSENSLTFTLFCLSLSSLWWKLANFILPKSGPLCEFPSMRTLWEYSRSWVKLCRLPCRPRTQLKLRLFSWLLNLPKSERAFENNWVISRTQWYQQRQAPSPETRSSSKGPPSFKKGTVNEPKGSKLAERPTRPFGRPAARSLPGGVWLGDSRTTGQTKS